MNILRFTPSFIALLGLLSFQAIAQNPVIVDGDVSVSEDELNYAVSTWTKQMRTVAIEDRGDRLELLNLLVTNKKMAASLEEYLADDGKALLDYETALRIFKRDYLLRYYGESIEYPDFEALAKERYELQKDKYALIPERRMSSHILIGDATKEERAVSLVTAEEILQQLNAGADFEEMVAQHSTEPGAAQKKGKIDRWMKLGEKGITPPYTEGLFSIDEIGGYSGLVETQFGVHIIRLDGIQEKSYKSFEEVKAQMIGEFRSEFKSLTLTEFVSQFQMSPDAQIDEAAVLKALEPYKKAE